MEYRGYKIESDGQFCLMLIKQAGQGPVPDALRGLFSTRHLAQVAIDSYENEKEAKNAKAKGRRTAK